MSRQAAAAGFNKARRLLTAADYSRVFDGAEAKASHRHLSATGQEKRSTRHRLGLVIAKKNVRLAVQRNRIKRVVREFFRQQPETGPGMDVVFLARRGIDQLDNAELSSILQQQWQRLGHHRPKQDCLRNL